MRKEQIITTTNNNQMEEKGMKQRFIHFKRKFVPALSGAIMGVMLMSTTCFAAGGTSAVTQPLENLKTLVIAVIGAVGVIILAKNVMEFAQAYQQQDSSTMNSALKGVVFQFRKNQFRISCDDIVYFEKKGRQAVIHTISENFKANMTTEEIWKQLDDKVFAHIHVSYIINLGHIRAIDGDEVVMDNEERLLIARSHKQNLKEKHMEFVRRMV